MLISVDLTSIGFDKNKILSFTQNFPDYNDQITFHCRDLGQKETVKLDVGIW